MNFGRNVGERAPASQVILPDLSCSAGLVVPTACRQSRSTVRADWRWSLPSTNSDTAECRPASSLADRSRQRHHRRHRLRQFGYRPRPDLRREFAGTAPELGLYKRRELHREIEQRLIAAFPGDEGQSDRTARGHACGNRDLRQPGMAGKAGAVQASVSGTRRRKRRRGCHARAAESAWSATRSACRASPTRAAVPRSRREWRAPLPPRLA